MQKNSFYLSKSYYDVAKIAESGQCFRFNKTGDHYTAISQDRYCTIWDKGEVLEVRHEHGDRDFWENYFDTHSNIYDEVALLMLTSKMPIYTQKAYIDGKGIVILKQDLWEMIVSYMIATCKAIPQIKSSIEAISMRYGQKLIAYDGTIYYAFPRAKTLTQADDLGECGLGFRAPRIRAVAQAVVSGELNLNKLRMLSYSEKRETLMQWDGIGPKVADCILLYGMHETAAFPIDTHIKQILDREYRSNDKQRYSDIVEKEFNTFGPAKGLVQQYLFFYERGRTNGRK